MANLRFSSSILVALRIGMSMSPDLPESVEDVPTAIANRFLTEFSLLG